MSAIPTMQPCAYFVYGKAYKEPRNYCEAGLLSYEDISVFIDRLYAGSKSKQDKRILRFMLSKPAQRRQSITCIRHRIQPTQYFVPDSLGIKRHICASAFNMYVLYVFQLTDFSDSLGKMPQQEGL